MQLLLKRTYHDIEEVRQQGRAAWHSMLALRNIVCSGRWKEDWPKIETHLRQHAYQQSSKLHQSRIKPVPASQSEVQKNCAANCPDCPSLITDGTNQTEGPQD